MERPNVLLIMTDQHRFDALGCYGNPVIETPNLDYIASRGTVFDCAYTPSPSCIPARACLISGMNQWNTGILGMGRGQYGMGVNFPHTLPGELAQAGYHTQGVGKMHFAPQRALNGFHNTVIDESGRREAPFFMSDYMEWFNRNKPAEMGINDHGVMWNSWIARPFHAPEWLHPSNWTVNESIKFLERRDPSKPFFLKCSFARPHSPYDAPAYYFDLYLKKDLPKAQVGDWAAVHDVPYDAVDPNAWEGKRTPEEIHRARAGYYGSINHLDHQLGRLMDALRRLGVLKNTLIIFTSDHGDMLGDQNLWRKTYAYEGSAHIPMIVMPPLAWNQQCVAHSDAPVTLYDIMPTILDACGLPIPDTVDGVSMMPYLRGEGVKRAYVHGEHCTCYSERQETQYVTDGKYKFVWLPRIDVEQFFDLQNDPYELKNRIDDPAYAELAAQWRGYLVEEMEKRHCGLTENGALVSQAGKPWLVSPNYEKRMKNYMDVLKK